VEPTMPGRVPISLIVDDSCPLVHVFAHHWRDVHHRPLVTPDGRPFPLWIPNDFLERFCDVGERWGMAGKFSIVPAPAGLGDVVRGIDGFDPALTREWLEIARTRLSDRWDFCSEGITHNLALNLETGAYFDQSENDWSQTQDRKTLIPYLVRQLSLLKEAGIDATGVTSPWVFGIQVEREYLHSIVAAQREVYGRVSSWYFLHMLAKEPASRPWVAFAQGETTLVSIPSTSTDVWWKTIDSPRTDPDWIAGLADELVTEDGREGQIPRVLQAGGWPVLLTHWQSLFSNGVESGLAVLDEVGRRVAAALSDRVQWQNFSDISSQTVADWRPKTDS
jgi:hypothetical protein